MRTLVLQLARFGDIYQTWPALRALHRLDPEGEVHVLVRERFKEATVGLSGITPHILPSRQLLTPLVETEDLEGSLREVEKFIGGLKALKFDRIVNLSFSPLSSFIVDAVAVPGTDVHGYTRHADGFLSIPDDLSAYFYAQVGIGRANRYHLTEIFASVSGVELQDSDFSLPEGMTQQQRSSLVVHLGASQANKTYPPELWVKALRAISQSFDGLITLIGSSNERPLAETVASQVPDARLINKVGATDLTGVFQELLGARLLIGADSAPVHMAALVKTPVLNLSSSAVNFWETGPLVDGSRVLYSTDIAGIAPERVAEEALALLAGEAPKGPCFLRPSWREMYIGHALSTDSFVWDLVQALYTGTPYPACDERSRLAFQRLNELADLALAQLERWNSEEQLTAARILASIDEMLIEVGRLSPSVEPLVQWFQTQRLRLPPDEPMRTWAETQRLFQELHVISAVYHKTSNWQDNLEAAGRLIGVCAPQLREYDFADVESEFQSLMSTLHDMARHSTKVGERSWSQILGGLQGALERRDFIELADQLEFELQPSLAHVIF